MLELPGEKTRKLQKNQILFIFCKIRHSLLALKVQKTTFKRKPSFIYRIYKKVNWLNARLSLTLFIRYSTKINKSYYIK